MIAFNAFPSFGFGGGGGGAAATVVFFTTGFGGASTFFGGGTTFVATRKTLGPAREPGTTPAFFWFFWKNNRVPRAAATAIGRTGALSSATTFSPEGIGSFTAGGASVESCPFGTTVIFALMPFNDRPFFGVGPSDILLYSSPPFSLAKANRLASCSATCLLRAVAVAMTFPLGSRTPIVKIRS